LQIALSIVDMFVTQVACLSLPVYIHCHAQLYDNNCHKVGHDKYVLSIFTSLNIKLLFKLYQFFKPRDLILYSFLPLPVDQNEHVQGQLYIV